MKKSLVLSLFALLFSAAFAFAGAVSADGPVTVSVDNPIVAVTDVSISPVESAYLMLSMEDYSPRDGGILLTEVKSLEVFSLNTFTPDEQAARDHLSDNSLPAFTVNSDLWDVRARDWVVINKKTNPAHLGNRSQNGSGPLREKPHLRR